MHRTALALAAAALTPLALASPAHAAAAKPHEIGVPKRGVTYSGVMDHGPKADTLAFGKWRGSTVHTVVDVLGGSTWESIADTSWTRGRWSGVPAHYVWSMFMLPTKQPARLTEVASGRRDSVFKRAGAGLVRSGYAYSTIRPGWEMTGGWYRWGNTHESPITYRQAWRRIVNDLRSVPGQHFTFDWNTGNPNVDPRRWYPGDGYVDFIGVDPYDGPGFFKNPKVPYGRYGLDWLSWYAGQHHKRLTIPEWGLRRYCGPSWKGYDDVRFVRYMRGWIVRHRPAYEAYFNADDNACQRSAMLPGRTFPRAAAAYRAAW